MANVVRDTKSSSILTERYFVAGRDGTQLYHIYHQSGYIISILTFENRRDADTPKKLRIIEEEGTSIAKVTAILKEQGYESFIMSVVTDDSSVTAYKFGVYRKVDGDVSDMQMPDFVKEYIDIVDNFDECFRVEGFYMKNISVDVNFRGIVEILSRICGERRVGVYKGITVGFRAFGRSAVTSMSLLDFAQKLMPFSWDAYIKEFKTDAATLKWLLDESLFSRAEYLELKADKSQPDGGKKQLRLIELLCSGIAYKKARQLLFEDMEWMKKCGIRVSST